MIEVAAAVLQRPDGSFLLARRPEGKVYAGYWEFPGGKVEPGECAAVALARELHEELGIDVERSYPWLTRTFTYPHGTVRLNFRRVTSWAGEPHPREKQLIAWQSLSAPLASPMLPANAPVLASLALPVEYAITDAGRLGATRALARLDDRLAHGLRLVQVREPDMNKDERARFTSEVLKRARRYGCRVMTKEPVEGASGVHLTARALMSITSRPEARGLMAASCHNSAELAHAMALDLDFVVVGPVKRTRSHPAVEPLGWERFSSMVQGSSVPVYAIGGLETSDLEACWHAGAHGVAMVSGAWARPG